MKHILGLLFFALAILGIFITVCDSSFFMYPYYSTPPYDLIIVSIIALIASGVFMFVLGRKRDSFEQLFKTRGSLAFWNIVLTLFYEFQLLISVSTVFMDAPLFHRQEVIITALLTYSLIPFLCLHIFATVLGKYTIPYLCAKSALGKTDFRTLLNGEFTRSAVSKNVFISGSTVLLKNRMIVIPLDRIENIKKVEAKILWFTIESDIIVTLTNGKNFTIVDSKDYKALNKLITDFQNSQQGE